VVYWARKGGENVEKKLTKDADQMICEIYSVYLERHTNGVPKRQAKDFADQSLWPEKYRARWMSPDGKDTLKELKDAGFIRYFIYGGFELTNETILYMENRFKNGISEVLEWLGKIKNVIPFA
jgi:hypothetical protein